MFMKTKFVLASFFAALGGLAAFAPALRASPDVRIRVDLRPPVVVVAERDHDRDHGHSDHIVIANGPPQAPRGAYGNYWYEQQRRAHHEGYQLSYPAPRGYWKDVVVRQWIPAHWEYGYDNCGRQIRTFQPGHDECRTERVWVDECR